MATTPKDRRLVRIHLKGDPRLEVDGRRVEGDLPGRLGRALLAYLVLKRHRQVTRHGLVDALWPVGAPRDPGATLSTVLSSLRRALGPGLLEGRAELPAGRVAGRPAAGVPGGEAPDDAVSRLGEMVSRLDDVQPDFFWLTAVVVLGEASGKLGHRESADILYETLAPYAGRMVQVGWAGSLGPVSRVLGLLAAARGDRDAVVTHLEDALARSEASGLRLFETLARRELEEVIPPRADRASGNRPDLRSSSDPNPGQSHPSMP